MYLILACFWLFVGVFLATFSTRAFAIEPTQRYLFVGLAGLMIVYNLLRWWMRRALLARRAALEQPPLDARERPYSDPPECR